jgi:hypothetical protein
VRVLKSLNRKDKKTGQEFYRWLVHLEPDLVKKLGWKEGTELEGEARPLGVLLLRRRRSP